MAESEFPPAVRIRSMVADDVFRGFLETLVALSPTGLSCKEALSIYSQREQNPHLLTLVAIATMGPYQGKVVGTLSVVYEQRFIHRGGITARIEDFAVHPHLQRQGIGQELLGYAILHAKSLKAYKITLIASDDNVSYYEQFGFKKSANNLRLDLAADSSEAIN